MDQTEFNPQNPGICHKLLISILPIDCPVCKGIAICSRLFHFSARSALSLAASRIFGNLLDHVLLILQRLHEFIMQTLVAQANKPVRLGSFKDHSSIETPDFHASGAENGIGMTNDQSTMQLVPDQDASIERNHQSKIEELQAKDEVPHQDPSIKKDHQPMMMIEESQANKEVDDSTSMLTDSSSSYDYPRDDRDQLSHITDTSLIQEKVDKEEEQEKVSTPTVMQRARAPKKTVSINENVEIFPISKNNKTMSKEWSSSALESMDEKSKPLKSILKVGSKPTNVTNE